MTPGLVINVTGRHAVGTRDMVAIHTNRLVLRPYCREDIDPLHALWTHPDVRRYLWDDEIISRDVVVAEVHAELERFRERGFGQFAVREPGSEQVVGFCGFREFHDPPRLELLFGLHPGVWGRGYAQEAARAVQTEDGVATACQAIEAHLAG